MEADRIRHDEFALDLETGVGLSSGQGSDPQVMLRWSDDGGHTWSNEHWVGIGALGEYRTRAVWRRLGQARDRIYEVSGTDPVQIAIAAAYIAVEEGIS